ncbi:DNA topoisomerase IB [Sideroxydans sp. CL21]|uniref:DNA topoisomerase IB n=1 Tax=Sideroxydans sp. CL21 TaxID=2600596 RepID=UPI0024BCE172|nr:DNA topoisomerase IB [Sideroxydans sp. CL21]
MMTTKHKEYCKSATRAGLHYVTDGFAGISRRRSGKGWSYYDEDGARIAEMITRERLNALAIPPAWINVWICPDPDGHIQVTARDARGRKQYRYHASYRAARDQSKFRRMLEFSEILPLLRERVELDLRAGDLTRRQLLATLVRLLDKSLIRVGNDEYARDNHSYGLTTMRSKHALVEGPLLRFSFRGKSGVEHSVTVDDPRIARIVQRCQDMHGQEIFQYVDAAGKRRVLVADDVNNYLRTASGRDITAKDFRTWGGTMVAAVKLRALGPAGSRTEAERNIVQALDAVAERLGNTRAVCRKYYVHPALLAAYHLGLTAPLEAVAATRKERRTSSPAALRRDEVVVLQFLHESGAGR